MVSANSSCILPSCYHRCSALLLVRCCECGFLNNTAPFSSVLGSRIFSSSLWVIDSNSKLICIIHQAENIILLLICVERFPSRQYAALFTQYCTSFGRFIENQYTSTNRRQFTQNKNQTTCSPNRSGTSAATCVSRVFFIDL